ncbi:MAG: hypothetical protein J7527_09290 [Chitinophagaceae bacterium]|nr:hypothetical protein [Chitinophagaceae bacterium]
MKFQHYISILLIAIAGVPQFSACSKMDAYKEEFMAGGEIIYAGALDTVIAQSGYKRINLQMVLGKDPQVTKIKAYWNDKRDSVEIAVQRPLASDTVNYLIGNLTAGGYSFTVYTFDAQEHMSVLRNASGVAYDDDYVNSLANRTLRSIAPNTAVDSLILKWNDSNLGQIKTELIYTLRNGGEKVLTLLPGDSIVGIPDEYVPNSELRYRSFYKPNENAYDVFASPEYSEVTLAELIYERQLAKSGFRQNSLPGDVGNSQYATWTMAKLWDNTYAAPGYATAVAALPLSFTFDTGESTSINRLIYWMPSDRIFNTDAAKSFEIWGSDAPAANGSWDSWTLLGTFNSVKPSGSAPGTNTAADVAAAAAGQEYVFPANLPKTRYIRIKALSRWGTGTFISMGELTFFTKTRR